jgi:urease accessory protein
MMQRLVLAFAMLVLAAGPVAAHDLAGSDDLATGFAHPFLGLDHLLAMTAVGLWSAIAGGRALWLCPALFVATMLGGYGVGAAEVALPLVEPAILASVVALGFLVAAGARLPLAAGASLVAFFALFHGHAHGAEAPAGAAAMYVLGFVLATATLHLLGIAIAQVLVVRRPAFVRVVGAATALAGLVVA